MLSRDCKSEIVEKFNFCHDDYLSSRDEKQYVILLRKFLNIEEIKSFYS